MGEGRSEIERVGDLFLAIKGDDEIIEYLLKMFITFQDSEEI